MSSEPLPLVVRRHPRARGMRLAIDPRDGGIRLTLPPRGSLGAALRWAEQQRPWIERALAACPPPQPLVPGAWLPVDGRDRLICLEEGVRRTPELTGDRIVLGGPAEAVAARLLRWLRTEALRVLEGESRALAEARGIVLGRVGVGDPRSRWASCSRSGDLRYSWRLLMAPPDVRRAVIAHELAHRRHMDHSPAFHAEVARILGHAPVAERRWLREHGARLQRVGR